MPKPLRRQSRTMRRLTVFMIGVHQGIDVWRRLATRVLPTRQPNPESTPDETTEPDQPNYG